MIEGKTVGVVIPAYNEELLLEPTLAGVPKFVDRIYVVDDASRDGTVGRAHTAAARDGRIVVIVHERNGGVGAAVVTGYKRAIEDRMDVVCVMNADNQMDPEELEGLATPVALGELDYAKANRLFTGQAWDLIPHTRYLGNAALSLLTKIASGYWHVADSQAGYTAIGLQTLERLQLERVYTNYGYPNDMLVHLNIWNARVRDVPSRPIYGVGERSGIRLRRVVPKITWLLFKRFWWRLWHKYVIRDFHPLVFFYVFGVMASLLGLAIGVWQTTARYVTGDRPTAGTVVLIALFMMFGLLFTLFAMWFDMETNKDLR
jgi:glycosyltransferase involved in cell wall biosynthesis